MEPHAWDRRTKAAREAEPKASLNFVVEDKADKTGCTWAVVWQGALLPMRFSQADARKHLDELYLARSAA